MYFLEKAHCTQNTKLNGTLTNERMHFCLTRFIILGWICGWLDFNFRYFGPNTKIPFTRSDGTAYSDGCARYRLTAEVRWCGFYSCDVSDLLTLCSGRRVRRFFPIEMVFRVVGLVHRWLMVWQVAVSFIACALCAFTHIQKHMSFIWLEYSHTRDSRLWCCTEWHPCVTWKSTHGRVSRYMCVRNNMPGDHQRKPAYICMRL